MLKVRFHGRGGQGAKVASRILGTAAFLEGRFAQDFPLYGAERRGAPIVAFTRISDGPVLERGVIAEPDIVIVMDETLLEDPSASPLSGLGEDGTVLLNTPLSREDAAGKYRITQRLLTLDMTGLSLETLGRPVLSTPAGGAAARLAGIGEKPLKEAVRKELSAILTGEGLMEKNIEAALRSFNAISPGAPAPKEKKAQALPQDRVVSVPFEPAAVSSPAIGSPANTPGRKTGSWRVFKPVWDYDICTRCMTCVARCPEGVISVNEEGLPCADYDNCKGCLVCVSECPVKAIAAVREKEAAHGE